VRLAGETSLSKTDVSHGSATHGRLAWRTSRPYGGKQSICEAYHTSDADFGFDSSVEKIGGGQTWRKTGPVDENWEFSVGTEALLAIATRAC
jgi:hypothetical protein